MYGLLEKQFRITIKKAEKLKGETGTNMLQLLERRLDNVVYRLSFASSRPQARQMVNHAHFLVNDIKGVKQEVYDKLSTNIDMQSHYRTYNYAKVIKSSVYLEPIRVFTDEEVNDEKSKQSEKPQQQKIESDINENKL